MQKKKKYGNKKNKIKVMRSVKMRLLIRQPRAVYPAEIGKELQKTA